MAPIERLTDDLLLEEILSRLPAKSVCRFKCAYKNWLRLVDHPGHRKSLPHSLAGFFYNSASEAISAPHFVNASASGRSFINPSFAFLPDHRRLHLLDCCNGLILCRLYDVSTTGDDEFRYVVCNPATEEWVALPDRSKAGKVDWARLGFDPAASPHFHVFVLLLDARQFISRVDVYSSETRAWIHKDKQWDEDVRVADTWSPTVYLNGYLHLLTVCAEWHPFISVVDTKGETWSNFETPGDWYGNELYGGGLSIAFIQRSQGQLHYATFHHDEEDAENEARMQVYALENYANKDLDWIVKHTVELSQADVFGGIFEGEFCWIAIHPESNLIYFIEGSDDTLKCYSMDQEEATEVCTLGEGQPPYMPYVPLYSKLESLSM
ncbi:unnamed protein product [Alopecurus aequalis]